MLWLCQKITEIFDTLIGFIFVCFICYFIFYIIEKDDVEFVDIQNKQEQEQEQEREQEKYKKTYNVRENNKNRIYYKDSLHKFNNTIDKLTELERKIDPTHVPVFIDLRVIFDETYNISFKENREYFVNGKLLLRSRFLQSVKFVTDIVPLIITETTEGEHASGEFSHYNGYKVDFRTKDLDPKTIFTVLKIFEENDVCAVYEYENNDKGLEILNVLKEANLNARPAKNAEHIDVNFMLDKSCTKKTYYVYNK